MFLAVLVLVLVLAQVWQPLFLSLVLGLWPSFLVLVVFLFLFFGSEIVTFFSVDTFGEGSLLGVRRDGGGEVIVEGTDIFMIVRDGDSVFAGLSCRALGDSTMCLLVFSCLLFSTSCKF